MSCGERARREREWAGERGSTAVVSRALGDCLRAGWDVGGRDRTKWEPLTGHDARDVLHAARPRAPATRVRCPVCLDTLVPPCPEPLACWVPGVSCYSSRRAGASAIPGARPPRTQMLQVRGGVGAGRVASTWHGHPAPANCRVSVPFAPCPASRTVPGWPAGALLDAVWGSVGISWGNFAAPRSVV